MQEAHPHRCSVQVGAQTVEWTVCQGEGDNLQGPHRGRDDQGKGGQGTEPSRSPSLSWEDGKEGRVWRQGENHTHPVELG